MCSAATENAPILSVNRREWILFVILGCFLFTFHGFGYFLLGFICGGGTFIYFTWRKLLVQYARKYFLGEEVNEVKELLDVFLKRQFPLRREDLPSKNVPTYHRPKRRNAECPLTKTVDKKDDFANHGRCDKCRIVVDWEDRVYELGPDAHFRFWHKKCYLNLFNERSDKWATFHDDEPIFYRVDYDFCGTLSARDMRFSMLDQISSENCSLCTNKFESNGKFVYDCYNNQYYHKHCLDGPVAPNIACPTCHSVIPINNKESYLALGDQKDVAILVCPACCWK